MNTQKKFRISAIAMPLLFLGCDSLTSDPPVSFSNQVMPILTQHCLECHAADGAGVKSSGLNLTNYENTMSGTRFGPVIKAGDSLSSTLIILIEQRADKSINMPHGDRPPLMTDQINIIRRWIDQGAQNN